jgi:hypothetical protein
MTKKNRYIILIIGLLVFNALLIAFIAFRKPPHPPNHVGPRGLIVNSLHFDKAQTRKFEDLIKIHREATRKGEEKIKRVKSKLYQELSKQDDASAKDSLYNQLSQYQTKIEHTNYNHFLDIKGLCRPEQMGYFKELTKKMSDFFSNKPPKRP